MTTTFGQRYEKLVEPALFDVLESASFTRASWFPADENFNMVPVLRSAIPVGPFTQRAWVELLAFALVGLRACGAIPADMGPLDGMNALYAGSLRRGGSFSAKRIRKLLVKMLKRDPPRKPLEVVGAIAMCAVLTKPESELH